MQPIVFKLLRATSVCAVVLLIVSADRPSPPIHLGGTPTQAGQPESARAHPRDLTQEEASAVLDHVFHGRPRTALAYLDSLEGLCSDGPLYHIMRARCFQELIPMDDTDTDLGKEISRPSLDELDRCIKICTDRIDNDPGPQDYFHRGWAWMAKAYVRSMTRSLWAAGRDAGRGKKDLERFLSLHPDDPTANGIMGSFLYFADMIPKAFKFLSKILRLPTGDRERGLELLEIAVRGGGLLETDWRLILYNVYFYFEGRYEEGLTGLQEMSELYPGYARTAVPLAVSRPYAPRLAVKNDMLVTKTIGRLYGAPHNEVDWNGLYLVQVFRAYGDRYCNHSSATSARLRSIIHESPRHPDWVESFARLELGRLHASLGERDRAVGLFESVAKSKTFDYLRNEAKILLKDVDAYDDYFDRPAKREIDRWITTLYQSNPDSLRALQERFEAIATKSLIAKFYLAECHLLSGHLERAFEIYLDIIEADAPAWDHTYQLIASTRIAEIYAARGYYKSAAKYQGYAMNFYHREYLIDWVLEGRKRYFERLAEGKEPVPPTLLSSSLGVRER
ncbi:MAG: hypothetical protein JSW58_01910 [Candidatus Latescibacterota bacterium]|nr:MAG: hypothetical protein JSW58_01910 [Candidatus Latescibacterota bacterium]